MKMHELTQSFIACYQQLNKENLDSLADIYHQQVSFQDPVVQLEGLDQLNHYFSHLYENIEHSEFLIREQTDIEQGAYISWTMHCKNSRLKQPLVVDGISHLQYQQGKIMAHRDYFDVGQMVYEQIPLLGSVIRHVKQGLKPTDLALGVSDE
jgi:hypothetical protein